MLSTEEIVSNDDDSMVVSVAAAAASVVAPAKRSHNKSGKTDLGVCSLTDAQLKQCQSALKSALKTQPICDSVIRDSPHQFYTSNDGRISVASKKLCYAYQLVALNTFGRSRLLELGAVKNSPDSISISHLCGEQCITAEHLKLETKRVNDERAIHHRVLLDALHEGGRERMEALDRYLVCRHQPRCSGDFAPFEVDSQDLAVTPPSEQV